MRRTPKRLDHEPEAVTYARRQAGLTVTELAKRCGVTKSLISEIEKGSRNATPDMLNKLAEALNCPRVVLESKRVPQTSEAVPVDVQPLRDSERAVPDELQELRR